MQESLLRAWRSREALKDPGAARPWLLTIVRREHARLYERKRLELVPLDDVVETHAGEASAQAEDDLFALRHAIMKLPLEYREPLVLQVLGGFSTEEIAQELALSSTAVLTRLFRARNKLRVICGMAAGPGRRRRATERRVNCEHARLLIGAEPATPTAELAEHLQGCAALRDVPRARCSRSMPASRARCSGRRTAGIGARRAPLPRLAAVGAGRERAAGQRAVLGVWLLRPSDTLARDLVTHVQHEPDSWLATQQVTAQGIDEALHRAGVALDADLRPDHLRAQLLVPRSLRAAPGGADLAGAGNGAAAAPREGARRAAQRFSEGGMNGVIVPAQTGAASPCCPRRQRQPARAADAAGRALAARCA